MSAPIIFPHALVNEIMEIKILEALEFAACRRKHFLADPYVVVHRATNIETKQDLYRIVALRNHPDIQDARVTCCLVDRVLEVQLVRSTLARELAETSERNFDIARTQLHLVVQIAVLTPVPDLGCTPVARPLLPDTDPLRVVAVGSKWRGACRADPLVTSLMAFSLLLQALTQSLHQLFESAQSIYFRTLLVRENELGLTS